MRGQLPGGHIKNLFLRDKKRRLFLLTVFEDREIDLKVLGRMVGASGHFSFANAEILMQSLGVVPGAVTPFGVVNDREGVVTMVLDNALLAHNPVNARPLRNDMTTVIAPEGLIRFLEQDTN